MKTGENVNVDLGNNAEARTGWEGLEGLESTDTVLQEEEKLGVELDDSAELGLGELKIDAPEWLRVEPSDKYDDIDWDLLGETTGDFEERPVLADLDKELAGRLRRLKEESGLDFRQMTITLMQDLYDSRDSEAGSRLAKKYAGLKDKSLVEIVAVAEVLGGDFKGVPDSCRTDEEIDKFYGEFRRLCEELRVREEEYGEDSKRARALRKGAGIFMDDLVLGYRPDVNYDMAKIGGAVELLGSPANVTNGMIYMYDYQGVDAVNLAGEALVAGREPGQVEDFLMVRQQVGEDYEKATTVDVRDYGLLDVVSGVMIKKMWEVDKKFQQGELGRVELEKLLVDSSEIRKMMVAEDGEGVSRNYNLLLEAVDEKLAERCREIARERKLDMSAMELVVARYEQDEEWDKERFGKMSDESLAKLAEIVEPLAIRNLRDYRMTEKMIGNLHENMQTIQSELSGVEGMGPKTLAVFVEHLTSVRAEAIPGDVAAAKRLLEVARGYVGKNATDGYCKNFVETAFREQASSRYTLDEIAEYYQVGKEVRDEHSELALSVLRDVFRNGKLKPGEARKYQEQTAPLVGEIAAENDTDQQKLAQRLLGRYGLAEDTIIGVKDKILPLVQEESDEVASLTRWGKFRGLLRGEDRLMQFEAEALTERVSPANMNMLMLDCRNLPTSDLKRLEQNRIDALAIEGVVLEDHGFIHDEAPLTNKLLSAMMKYYDAQGTEGSEWAEAELQRVVAECQMAGVGRYGRLAPRVFDLRNYDKRIEGKVNDDERVQEYDETAIGILRRLVENTKQDQLEVPKTGDEVLNGLMERVVARQDSETGEIRVDWREVSILTAYMNKQLMDRQDEVGIEPSMVKAATFVERMTTFAMRGITLKDWRELPYDPGFKEMVRFRELTGSGEKFSEQGFEDFWQGFQNMGVEPDDEKIRANYQKLQKRILRQLNRLAGEYNANEKSQYVGALWSGNLSHELIGLTEKPQPRTMRERMERRVDGLGV